MASCRALVVEATWDLGNPIFELRPKAPPLSRREKALAGSSLTGTGTWSWRTRKTDCCCLLQVSPCLDTNLYLQVSPGQPLLSLGPAHQWLLAFCPHSLLHPRAFLGYLVAGDNWVLGPTSNTHRPCTHSDVSISAYRCLRDMALHRADAS